MCHGTEAVIRRFSIRKMFLEILQNSYENTCARASFLIKLQALGLLTNKFYKGRWNRLKTGAAERIEEKQSHVVALCKQLGVWGHRKPPKWGLGRQPPPKKI